VRRAPLRTGTSDVKTLGRGRGEGRKLGATEGSRDHQRLTIRQMRGRWAPLPGLST